MNDTTRLRLAVPSLKDKRIFTLNIARDWLRGKRLSDLINVASEKIATSGDEVGDHFWDVLQGTLAAQLSDDGMLLDSLLSKLTNSFITT